MLDLRSARPLRHINRWGLIAGLCALILWPVHALAQEPARLPFLAALTVTALCGAVVLAMTLIDLVTVRRDRSVLPARVFDLALGVLLALPSGAALIALLP